MNTVLELRMRAAAAELRKPGHWRLAFSQLLQATDQLFANPHLDRDLAALAFDALTAMYQYVPCMRPAELSALNSATGRLHRILAES